MMKVETSWAAKAAALLAAGALAAALAGCQPTASAAKVPTPAPTTVPSAAKVVWTGTYAQNIQPIFDQHCTSCHGAGKAEQGLRLDSYDGVMKGTQYGQVVVPGSPTTSALESVVIGTAAPSIQMPHGGARLSPQEVENITLWIQAGAPQQ